jgi:hypothetical protein
MADSDPVDPNEPSPRQEFEFAYNTIQRGKITVKMVDRINVDDVFLHLVNQELFRILTRENIDDEVNPLFKDFLLKERFTAGQN